MKTAFIIAGVCLILFGAVALALHGITYSEHETVFRVGNLHATAERQKTILIPPIYSGLALLAGVVLALIGFSKTKV